jgi:hypothetical protein
MKKRIISAILAAVMILTLAGCENSELADANRRLQEQIDDLRREQRTTTAPPTTGEPSTENIGFTITTPEGWWTTVLYEFGTSIDSLTITWGVGGGGNDAGVVVSMMTEKAVEDEFGEVLSSVSSQRLLGWFWGKYGGGVLREQTEATLAGMQAIRAKYLMGVHDFTVYVVKHEQAAFFIVAIHESGNVADETSVSNILNSFGLCSDISFQNICILDIRFSNDDVLKNNEILAEFMADVRAQDLTELHISGNQISDVSSLARLTNLESLHLSGNPLTNEQVQALRAALHNTKAEYPWVFEPNEFHSHYWVMTELYREIWDLFKQYDY